MNSQGAVVCMLLIVRSIIAGSGTVWIRARSVPWLGRLLRGVTLKSWVVITVMWISVVIVAAGCDDKSMNKERSVHSASKSRPPEVSSESPNRTNDRPTIEDESALTSPGLPVQASEGKQSPESMVNTTPDEEYRKRILGTWQDNYQGKRTMTVRDDGTASMTVNPGGLAALAGEMTFEEEWKIENGRLNLHATGGEPRVRVNFILETMGKTVDYRILELTRERMLLEDNDGKTRFDWRRIDQFEEATDD